MTTPQPSSPTHLNSASYKSLTNTYNYFLP